MKTTQACQGGQHDELIVAKDEPVQNRQRHAEIAQGAAWLATVQHLPLQAETIRRLDSFERSMLEFAISWAPYGGVPEGETLTEFGLSAVQFTIRCKEIIADGLHAMMVDRDRQLLRRAALALPPDKSVKAPRGEDDAGGHWVMRRGIKHWVTG
jgi:hypothetical protein